MEKKFLVTLLVFYNSLLLFGQYESRIKIDTSKLSMQINVNNGYCFACPLPLRVKLVANNSTELFDLNTGYLNFKLSRNLEFNSSLAYFRETATGGWFRNTTYLTGDSIYETILEELEQTKIRLEVNENISKEFDMTNLFNIYPEPGEYILTIEYEGQIKSHQKFNIVIDYQESITNIINILEDNRAPKGISLLNMFYYLTGYKSWNDSIAYQYSKHYKETPKLRIWWQDNKDLILRIESTLKLDKYKNLQYSKEIPKLIKSLQSSNYEERSNACNTLKVLTGVNDLLISEKSAEADIKKNVDIIQEWWNANKYLISWVNRVILETSSPR